MADYSDFINTGLKSGSDLVQNAMQMRMMMALKQQEAERQAVKDAQARQDRLVDLAMKQQENYGKAYMDVNKSLGESGLTDPAQISQERNRLMGMFGFPDTKINAKFYDGDNEVKVETTPNDLYKMAQNPQTATYAQTITSAIKPAQVDTGIATVPDEELPAQNVPQGTNDLALQMAQGVTNLADERRAQGLPVGIAENRSNMNPAISTVMPMDTGLASTNQRKVEDADLRKQAQLLEMALKQNQLSQAPVTQEMDRQRLALDALKAGATAESLPTNLRPQNYSALDEAIARKNAEKAGGLEGKIDESDKSFLLNVDQTRKNLDTLRDVVQKYGTFEYGGVGAEAPVVKQMFGKTPDALKASALMDQLPYELAVAYAKIVDPNSVAREGEVAAAQKYMIKLGLGANQNTALAQIDDMKRRIEDRLESYKKIKSPKERQSFINDLSEKTSNSQSSFKSISEAENANLPKGTVIYVNGRKAIVE